jgi:mRNA interferase RelE/StbE
VTYQILITRKAQEELSELDPTSYFRVKGSILQLGENPRPYQSKKLASRDGWRIRCGIYRVIYEISDQDKTVTVLHIGHRRDVYK